MKKISFILISLVMISCGRGYELQELFVQKINGSTKSIFTYGAWSTLSDGALYGHTIVNSGDSVEISDIEPMSVDIFSTIPAKDTLSTIRLKEGGKSIPTYHSTTYEKYKGFTLRIDSYLYAVGSSSNLTYSFSSFSETTDSLILWGIEKRYFNLPTAINKIGFRKGNIKLVESDSLEGYINRIEIRAFLLASYSGSIIDNQTIIRDSTLHINGLVYFMFEPKAPIKTSEFSDHGIYKESNIENVKFIK